MGLFDLETGPKNNNKRRRFRTTRNNLLQEDLKTIFNGNKHKCDEDYELNECMSELLLILMNFLSFTSCNRIFGTFYNINNKNISDNLVAY